MSDAEGFLTRWSRRKAERRAGSGAPQDAARPGDAARDASDDAADRSAATPACAPRTDAAPPPAAGAPQVAGHGAAGDVPALPTLADVAALTPTSDFSRFVAPGVDASVQHAALRKLFGDPHFNVMDGLDTYIDDYNTPNPIPKAMLERLVHARAMRLFDAPPQDAGAAAAAPAAAAQAAPAAPDAAIAPNAPAAAVARVAPAAKATQTASDAAEAFPDGANAPALPQSAAANETASPGPDNDEDTALRLQPDDAADAAGAGSHRAGPRA